MSGFLHEKKCAFHFFPFSLTSPKRLLKILGSALTALFLLVLPTAEAFYYMILNS